jgi:hypothetical protein
VRKDSSFSEEKEAKRLFIMAYGLALPAKKHWHREAREKVFLVLFLQKKNCLLASSAT